MLMKSQKKDYVEGIGLKILEEPSPEGIKRWRAENQLQIFIKKNPHSMTNNFLRSTPKPTPGRNLDPASSSALYQSLNTSQSSKGFYYKGSAKPQLKQVSDDVNTLSDNQGSCSEANSQGSLSYQNEQSLNPILFGHLLSKSKHSQNKRPSTRNNGQRTVDYSDESSNSRDLTPEQEYDLKKMSNSFQLRNLTTFISRKKDYPSLKRLNDFDLLIFYNNLQNQMTNSGRKEGASIKYQAPKVPNKAAFKYEEKQLQGLQKIKNLMQHRKESDAPFYQYQQLAQQSFAENQLQIRTTFEKMLQVYSTLPQYTQNFVIEGMLEKAKGDPSAYGEILGTYVEQLISKMLILLESNQIDTLVQEMGLLPASCALLLILQICEVNSDFSKASVLDTCFMARLKGQTEFKYIPKKLNGQLKQILLDQADRVADLELDVPAGFFILCIEQDLYMPLCKAFNSKDNNLAFLEALGAINFPVQYLKDDGSVNKSQKNFPEDSTIMNLNVLVADVQNKPKRNQIKDQMVVCKNFMFPSVIKFVISLMANDQKDYMRVIGKIQISSEPLPSELASIKSLLLSKPVVLQIMSAYPATIKLDLQAFSKVLSLLIHLNRDVLKQLVNTNDPAEWACLAEKEQSGFSELSLTGISNGDSTTSSNSNKLQLEQIKGIYAKLTSDSPTSVHFSYQEALDHSLRAKDLFSLYKHSPYQAMVLGIIVNWENQFILASLPTGSGKSWILLMLALYYKECLIIVPNDELQKQMQRQVGDCPVGINIITQAEFDPSIYQQKILLIDESDHFFLDQPYGIVKKGGSHGDYDLLGPWRFKKYTKIISLSATVTPGLGSFITNFVTEPKVLKFSSEYELLHAVPSFTIQLIYTADQQLDYTEEHNMDDTEQKIFLKGVELIHLYYKQKPLIIFASEAVMQALEAKFSKKEYIIYRYNDAQDTLIDMQEGILLLDGKVEDRGLDTRFAKPALVIVLCEVVSLTQLQQMAGRSNRTRGKCEAILLSSKFKTFISLERYLQAETSGDIQKLIILLSILQASKNWGLQQRKGVYKRLYQYIEEHGHYFRSQSDFFDDLKDVPQLLDSVKESIASLPTTKI